MLPPIIAINSAAKMPASIVPIYKNYRQCKHFRLREGPKGEKQIYFGFLLKGGGGSNPNPKLSRNFWKNPFSA